MYTWYGKYTRIKRKPSDTDLTRKIMFKSDIRDYDEAELEFESLIPEPYTRCKLLGHVDNKFGYNNLKQAGFVLVNSSSDEGVVEESLEDAWDYSDDELADIYGGDTGYDYEEPIEREGIVNLDEDSIDSKVQTMIDNIKNWTERDIHISSIASEDDTATFEVYIPETNEYIGSWDVDLNKCENQFYCGDIAAEIDAVEVEDADAEDVLEEGWQDNWVEPTMEDKPICNTNGLNIYKGTDQYGEEAYYLFPEDDSMPEPGYEEWQTETLELAKEWASSYEEPDDDWYIQFSDDEEDEDEDWHDLSESAATKTSLEAKQRVPKYWDTMFKNSVVDAYEAGVLTLDNIDEWEKAYNGGVAPFPVLGTEAILKYYINNVKQEPVKEGNPVSRSLPPSVDSFLQDVAQMTGAISYQDVMKHEYSEQDVKKLKNIRNTAVRWADEMCDEEYEDYLTNKIAPRIAAIVKANTGKLDKE